MMIDTSTGLNYFPAPVIVRFARLLRRLGVRVSVSEGMDAYHALVYIDLLDKKQVKGTLQALLVKDQREWRIFDQAFEAFFAPFEERREWFKSHCQQQAEQEQDLLAAKQELSQMLKPWEERLQVDACLTKEDVKTFARLPLKERERLKDIVGQMRGNPVNSPVRIVVQVVQSSLNYWRYYMMKKQTEAGEDSRHSLSGGSSSPKEGAFFYRDPGEQILYTDMQNIGDGDLSKMTALIHRLSTRLAVRLTRRYQRSNRAQTIDIRRTLRQNVRYGGIPLELRYRNRRRHKPVLLLVCDVSASMARYARFVLQFIYGLSSALKGIENFIFSEDLERITPYFRPGRDFARTMAAVINESKQWGRTTNFHVSLQTLMRSYKRLLTGDCLLIIVSDTKTIAGEQAALELADISRRVSKIIWLNPVPRHQWPCLPTLLSFQRHARMFECYNLFQLEQILCKEVVRQ